MRARRHKLQVSTFPFLAVLLCAMGSLILVLLVMDRKAHQAAQARARREAARLIEESAQAEANRRAEVEQKRRQAESAWNQKQEALHTKLTQEQTDLALQMRTLREKLGAIAARLRYEQDTGTELRRKVQNENGRLRAEERLLATLRSTAGQTQAQSQESSKALRRMTLDLLQMEQVLEDLKAAREKEQHTFSVVPYHGRRGENRKPIYVECTAQGVIFHPERRAMPVFVRDYLLGREATGDRDDDVRGEVKRRIAQQRTKLGGEAEATPYLLLLVRPDGIETYSQFQHVLKDMTLDFGYEFIDADWVLDFPADENPTGAQPWMASTRASPDPTTAPVASGTANTPHPVGMPPSGRPGTSTGSGVLGFRTGDGRGAPNWLGGSPNQGGSGTPASSGASAGGNAFSSGGGSVVASGAGLPGIGGNSTGGAPGLYTGSTGSSSGRPGGSGSVLAGPGGGIGHGHPAAMAPGLGANEGDPRETTGGSSGAPGAYVMRGSGRTYVPGAPINGPPMPNGSGVAALGPPTALSSGTPGSGASGTFGFGGPAGPGVSGTGASGAMAASGPGPSGNVQAGSSPTGVPGLGGPGSSAPGGSLFPRVSPDGRYTVARGNGGDGSFAANNSGGSFLPGAGGNSGGQPGGTGSGGSAPGATGALPAGAPGASWQRGGTPGGTSGTADANASVQPGAMGSSNPGGTGGGSVGQAPAGQAGVAGQSSGAARGGSPTAGGTPVYPGIDPLRPQPPPGSPSPAGDANEPSAERPPENATPPNTTRKRMIFNGGGGSQRPGDSSSIPNDHLTTPSYRPQPPRKPASLRPGWVHGGRDWIIYVECRADGVVLYPAEKHFPLAEAVRPGSSNPLVAALKQMIDRRQSLRRPGEPPYYPQVRLLVRPENVYTFLTVYPALEALPVPKKRQNLEPDDDVRDIVIESNP